MSRSTNIGWVVGGRTGTFVFGASDSNVTHVYIVGGVKRVFLITTDCFFMYGIFKYFPNFNKKKLHIIQAGLDLEIE